MSYTWKQGPSQQFLMVIVWFRTGMIGYRKKNRQSIIANRYRRIGIASWKINGCNNVFLLTIWITGNRRFVFKWDYLCDERTGMLVYNPIGKQTSFFVWATKRYVHRSSDYEDMGVSTKSVWFKWPFGLETHSRTEIKNTEWKRIVSLKSWMIDLGVGLYIKMDNCMVNRRETSVEIVDSIEEGSLWWIGKSWVDGNEAMDWIRFDENGKEWWWLQLRDSNARRCKWYRSEVEWIGIKKSRDNRLAWFLSHTQVIGGE